jgi:cobalt-precorrin-5B (C1)-methyltransferase
MMEKTVRHGTRTGFTTGACSAAAARAAALGLVHGTVPAEIESLLPNGSRVKFTVHDGRCDAQQAHAMVVKFAGDDPDCTDGAHLTADLRRLPGAAGQVVLRGGFGVGTVTLEGLGLEVGGPAINPVPRRNIEDNMREVAASLLATDGLEVTISVPQGVEMAKKTLNARLGILGGISILGTTGIVKPYSTAAYRASVVQGVQLAAALGQQTGHSVVVLTTGGRTEKFAMGARPELPEGCFVQMGDFLRYALDEAVAHGLQEVVIAGMVGKLTKIAQGETITHANRAEVDTDLLARLAQTVGASAADCADIAAAETARFAAERMDTLGLGPVFHKALAEEVVRTLMSAERYDHRFLLKVLVCDFDGNHVAEAASA